MALFPRVFSYDAPLSALNTFVNVLLSSVVNLCLHFLFTDNPFDLWFGSSKTFAKSFDSFRGRRGRKGLRWCGFALFLVWFCGNFYFNSRYCRFKTLSGLRLLQPLGRDFRWKKVSAVMTLVTIVGTRLLRKRELSVLFYNASGFINRFAIDPSLKWQSKIQIG